jgi:hypothetical protein
MRPSRDILLMTAALGATIALAACAVRPPHQYRLVPAPGPRYTIHEGGIDVHGETFNLTIVPLDDIGRAAFIKSRAAGAVDPFDPGPGGLSRYFTFKVLIENTGTEQPVVFQPQSVYLASEMGDRLFPLDFPEAYRLLFGNASSDPRLADDLSKYLFDVGVSVDPGKRAEGLLIYPVVKISAHRLRMEFSFLSMGGEPNDNYDIFFNRETRD